MLPRLLLPKYGIRASDISFSLVQAPVALLTLFLCLMLL
jgi:hypothetical protein